MFRKKQPRLTPPQGMGRGDISIDRSICTGEAVIGFRDRITRELRCAVAVRSSEDIAEFYRSYGFEPPQ